MSYLFSAYMVIWLVLFGYMIRLSNKQKKLDREIETLKKLVDERK